MFKSDWIVINLLDIYRNYDSKLGNIPIKKRKFRDLTTKIHPSRPQRVLSRWDFFKRLGGINISINRQAVFLHLILQYVTS